MLAVTAILVSGCAFQPEILVEDDDHVIVPGIHECWFKWNGYSYSKSVAFMSELQRRLKDGDSQTIADLVGYPLYVRGRIPMILKNRAQFLREIEHVFTPAVIAQALAADPQLVFCRYTGIMLGRGVIWADSGDGESYLVYAINQPDDWR